MKMPALKRITLMLIMLAASAMATAEEGVLDKAGRGIKKGGAAAERGIKKGADATGKGLQKGGEATANGVKKAGKWTGEKLDKVFK